MGSNNLTFLIEDKQGIPKPVRIAAFSVVGGPERSIDLDSAAEKDIISELHQARAHKNITVFLPPGKDKREMELLFELMSLAGNRAILTISFWYEKFTSRSSSEMASLRGRALIEVPTLVAKNLTMIEFYFKSVEFAFGPSEGYRPSI